MILTSTFVKAQFVTTTFFGVNLGMGLKPCLLDLLSILGRLVLFMYPVKIVSFSHSLARLLSTMPKDFFATRLYAIRIAYTPQSKPFG